MSKSQFFKQQKTPVNRKSMVQRKRTQQIPRNRFSAITSVVHGPFMPGGAEVKSMDSLGTNVVFNSDGTIEATPLNNMVEGSGFNNRIGRRVILKSVHIRGEITTTRGNAAALAQDYNRIIIYYDKQANGQNGNPTVPDLLLDVRSDSSTNTDAFSGINMNNRERFVILRDRVVVTAPVGVMGVGSTFPGQNDPNFGDNKQGLKFTEFIKLKNLETHYRASTTGVIGDISTGALGILCISLNGVPASETWLFHYTSRIKYVDT